ncbi:MAG: hypothetical protein JO316_09800 [Abitibacteriaceae bacterium]|nr:hypothetical protein [Abditibacteriaceae bacterium]
MVYLSSAISHATKIQPSITTDGLPLCPTPLARLTAPFNPIDAGWGKVHKLHATRQQRLLAHSVTVEVD